MFLIQTRYTSLIAVLSLALRCFFFFVCFCFCFVLFCFVLFCFVLFFNRVLNILLMYERFDSLRSQLSRSRRRKYRNTTKCVSSPSLVSVWNWAKYTANTPYLVWLHSLMSVNQISSIVYLKMKTMIGFSFYELWLFKGLLCDSDVRTVARRALPGQPGKRARREILRANSCTGIGFCS